MVAKELELTLPGKDRYFYFNRTLNDKSRVGLTYQLLP